MKKQNAAQILSKFIWNPENELPKNVLTGSIEKGFDVDQQVLLEYLIKFQSFLSESQETAANLSFEQLLADHLQFTSSTFPKGTATGALIHLEREIQEVRAELPADTFAKAVEFADCLGCLVDAANRSGVPPRLLFDAFGHKLSINKNRKWRDNGDGSYSHIKECPQCGEPNHIKPGNTNCVKCVSQNLNDEQ